jgi:alpha-D-xyloside xylohydrolase
VWQVYLPQGEWRDFWTEQTYAGGQTIAIAAPLDRIPVFVRAGATLPMG